MVNELVGQYYDFLKEKSTVLPDEQTGWTAISTPFLGLFNDVIEIYVKSAGDQLKLSDDGKTLQDLESVGVSLTRSQKRKELLSRILLNYGIHFENNELTVEARPDNFGQKKHNLISAISEIYDLSVLSKHTVASVFREDVQAYLDELDIVYTPDFISRGKTGMEYTFDFQIAYKEKEVVLKAFDSLTKLNVPHFLFSWEDIKDVRQEQTGKDLIGLAVVNDKDKKVKNEFLEALAYKGADYILWSNRYQSDVQAKLTA